MDVVPTIGFNVEVLQEEGVQLVAWDLGGQENLRPYWKCYYSDVDAVIFVVDATDQDRMEKAAGEFKTMVEVRDGEPTSAGISCQSHS